MAGIPETDPENKENSSANQNKAKSDDSQKSTALESEKDSEY